MYAIHERGNNMELIALKEIHDNDCMTQAAKGYENIPKGAKVTLVKIVRNLYGNYVRVRYNGNTYDVNIEDVVPI